MKHLLPNLLAKSAKFNEGREETLEEHTENVVAALAGLAHRFSNLAQVVGRSDFWHLAFWACVIHDFGKAALGFQKVLREEASSFGHRHEVLSLAFVPWVASEVEKEPITLGVISHHRDTEVIAERYDGVELRELTEQINLDVLKTLATWLEHVPNTWIDKFTLAPFGVEKKELDINYSAYETNSVALLKEGVRCYRQAHRRYRQDLADPEEIKLMMALRGIITQADRLASAHAPPVVALTLPTLPQITKRLSRKLNKQIEAKDHQKKSARKGHLLMIAPTGSGKTEAAIAWAAAQQQVGGAQRLAYVLPYQASLNAMQKRLQDDLSPPGGVSLLHSRSLQVLYQDLASGSSKESLETLTYQARKQNDFNRLHQPAVTVSTPYQLLRGAYRLPGYEALFTMLCGSAIVWDEIHAYEPKRLGLFLGLTNYFIDHWQVKVCAMTATMPRWLQQELEALLETSTVIPDDDIFQAARRHRLELLDAELTSDIVVNKIRSEVEQARSVLAAANTIKRAQSAYKQLKQLLGKENVILLHGRFTGDDRLGIELDLQQRLGADGPGEPIAVVATQVIEVSLNLDFDRIYTEPAPLEALVQRFGRVNRLGLKGVDGLVPVTVLTQPRDGQKVYDDRLIRLGLAQLEQAVQTGETIIDDRRVRDWLDSVYSPEILSEWREYIQYAREEFEDTALKALYPFESSSDLKQAFYALFEGTQVLPKSKLAEYKRRLKTAPISARGLLVNVPDWVSGRAEVDWNDEFKLFTADFPYSSELGLELP